MKKYIIILAALALAAGCNKEVEVLNVQFSDVPEGVFRAGFANADATKVSFDANGYKLTWEKADSISLFRSTYNEKFILEGEGGSSSGIFVSANPDAFVAGNPVEVNYALYPYDQSVYMTTLDGQECFSLFQNYSKSMEQYSCAPDVNLLMAATTSSQDRHLPFKSVYGYLVVPVYGSGKVHNISLQSNGGEAVSGSLYVKANPGGDPEILRISGGTQRTIYYRNPVQLSETSATDFWFALPPGTFENGFTVALALETEDGKTYTERRSTTISRTIRRNVVNRMASISLEAALSDWQYFTNPDGTVATVSFTQNWWGDTATARIKYQEAPWGDRYCVTETDPVESNGTTYYGFFHATDNESEATELQFTWYASKGNELELPYQSIGWYYSSYNAYVNVTDYASYFIHAGQITDWWDYLDYSPHGYYDGNGGFYFFVYRYYMDNVGGWPVNDYDIVGEADGYYRPKIDIDIDYDYQYGDSREVFVSTGKDIKTIYYQWYPGEVSVSAAEALAEELRSSGTNAVDMESGSATILLQQASSGIYTLVVTSDFGNYGVSSIEYAVPGDKDVDISVSSTEVGTSSASFLISGSALTNARAMWVDMEAFEASSATYMSKARSASSLDVGSIVYGGLSYTADGLKPDTRYALVVWASNDLKMDWVVLSFRTQEGKMQLVGTGTYTYTQFYSGSDTCELYVGENDPTLYCIKDWGDGVPFYFTLTEAGVITVPDQFTGYNHSSYGNVNVVEVADYFGSDSYGHSYYDVETGTFVFNVIYYVSAGYFGYGEETFVMDDTSSSGVTRSPARRKLSTAPLKEFRLPFEP